ncbi:MAG: N-6 DNA methylase [Clostridiales Family XIII bacterium]|nr:N-6 DNA methylase [Clostridiales Family XIII bacterium]
MLVSLSEYGELHGKSGDTLRRLAERGVLKTAYKIGRNWVVDSDEVYPVTKRSKRGVHSLLPEQLNLSVENSTCRSDDTAGNTCARYSNESAEKSNGIIYTPTDLAEYVANKMIETRVRAKDKYYILDPAIGNGELVVAFLNALNNRFGSPEVIVVGYETDADIIPRTEQRIVECCANARITIENRDFLELMGGSTNQRYDFIIANPPYIRTQILGAAKAQGIAALAGLDGRIDIYYAFLVFAERLLTDDGVAGFITSNKFMTIKAGQAVRKYLTVNTDILRITDFGDTKLFAASVLPCVIVFRKKQSPVETIHTSVYESKECEPSHYPDNIFDGLTGTKNVELQDGRRFSIIVGTLQSSQDGLPWRINTTSRKSWLAGIERNTVKRFCDLGKIRVGIKTTADNVFIRDSWEQEEFVPELIRPLITHRNAGQVSPDSHFLWQVLYTHTVINGKKIAYDIEEYPNTLRYLSAHREQLEGRPYVKKANRNWYEIWVPQNPEAWGKRKIVFRDIADTPQFWLDETGAVVNGDCYWIDFYNDISEDDILLALAVANSSFTEQYYDVCFNNKLYSGKRRFMSQYVEQFPLPDRNSHDAQAAIELIREIVYAPVLHRQKEIILSEINTFVNAAFSR